MLQWLFRILRLLRRFGVVQGSRALAALVLQRTGSKSEQRLRIPGGKSAVSIRTGDSDWDVMAQVFVDEYYATSYWTAHHAALQRHYERLLSSGRTPIIVDCGANVGFSAIWYALHYPAATVIAIEPEPANVAVLRRNAAPYANIKVLPGAVLDRQTRLQLHNDSDKSWLWETRESPEGEVEAFTISQVLAQEGGAPLIVKIDIEGAETMLFRSQTDWVSEIPLIAIELHDWMPPIGRGSGHAVFSALVRSTRDYLFNAETLFAFSIELIEAET